MFVVVEFESLYLRILILPSSLEQYQKLSFTLGCRLLKTKIAMDSTNLKLSLGAWELLLCDASVSGYGLSGRAVSHGSVGP